MAERVVVFWPAMVVFGGKGENGSNSSVKIAIFVVLVGILDRGSYLVKNYG